MVRALDLVIEAGYRTACLTNNVVSTSPDPSPRHIEVAAILAKFDHVVESSKVGCRKPEPRFYEIACELVGVSPEECIFLDDLGINLKPAAAMGMRTIKVGDPTVALCELSDHLQMTLH
jgi:putative hydrolase of the HAD superfamily